MSVLSKGERTKQSEPEQGERTGKDECDEQE